MLLRPLSIIAIPPVNPNRSFIRFHADFARCAYHGIVQTLPGIVQNQEEWNAMSSNITPCRCSMAAEALILENATTVPAGSVSNGLSVCGYETELNQAAQYKL